MKLPIYLFTGFLEGGKTAMIQESLSDQNFNSGEKTLVLMCEEGIEELDPTQFWGQNVRIEYIESEDQLTRENLENLVKGRKVDRVIIEYNGMWLLETLYANMPSGWAIYQNIMFADANTFISYNNNMRQLTVDKIRDAEMVVLNRTPQTVDKEQIHKIIRGISRRAAIVYDYPDRHVEYDEIEDPLPFDINADIVKIEDRDFAIWYRDLCEEPQKYVGKTLTFKALVGREEKLGDRTFVAGRHIMICCQDDIAYRGMVCVDSKKVPLQTGAWIQLTAHLQMEKHALYQAVGPVLHVIRYRECEQPQEPVATFY